MRILHTSDWHLGQHFIGKTRAQEHWFFLDWLLTCIEQQQVDAVVIAGDIFDTGAPPSYARTLLNRFIGKLQEMEAGCQLVILGGNHDSVATLHESRSVLSYLNTHVIGAATSEPEQQVIMLNDKNGHPGVVVCAVPYIRPQDVLISRAGESGRQKEQALLSAMAEHYQAVYDIARKQAEALEVPVIATGHLTTTNGKLSDSEREIKYIGNLLSFTADAFPPASYIALGHLHRAQKVANHNHIRYSGSPIPLSFDEIASSKQVLVVDFEGDQLSNVTEIEVPRFRKLASLQGKIDDIQSQLDEFLREPLQEEPLKEELVPWIEVVVDAPEWVSDLQAQVDEMVAGLPVEVLRVRRMRQERVASLTQEAKETLDELNVDDVFSRRLEGVELADEERDNLMNAFHQLVADIEENQLAGADGSGCTTIKYQSEVVSRTWKESV